MAGFPADPHQGGSVCPLAYARGSESGEKHIKKRQKTRKNREKTLEIDVF